MPGAELNVPTLQVVAGPLAGRRFRLDRDAVLIGRNSDCDIVLDPKSVSRRHASVFRKGLVFELHDLRSTQGTFVDGQRISDPVVLQDGMTVKIGEVLLAFSNRTVQIHDESNDQSTVYAAIDLINQSDLSPPLVKPEEKLRALRLISQELGGALVLSEVLERVFNSLFAIFPRAQRGFVLLREPGSIELIPEVVRSRTGEPGELSISKTILNRALHDGQAILCKDVSQEFPESTSASDAKLRSLMCAPLLDQSGRPMGVMQIDTRDGRNRFEQGDLDVLAAVASQVSIAVQNAQMHKAVMKQREMEQELIFARQVMQSLLPERPAAVPGYDFWAYYEPARHVGGDYYGCIPTGAGDPRAAAELWAIAIGDVVGKGMPAALMTAKLSAEIRLFLRSDSDPVRVVSMLNRQFDDRGSIDMYITFLLIVLDTRTHTLRLVNAGHPPPLVRRANGTIEELSRSVSGLPLLIMPDYPYECAETTLAPGDTVVLYTDGVTDALCSSGDRFGDANLRHAFASSMSASEAGDKIIKTVLRHVADHPQFDDITLVAFSRK